MFTTRTAAGTHVYQRAILADLRDHVANDRAVLVTNFNPAIRREDSSAVFELCLR